MQLRLIAGTLFRRERADHTLQPTALANEAYIRLARGHEGVWDSRAHFFGSAARAMKRVLVDHARKHAAKKRFGSLNRVELSAESMSKEEGADEVLALAAAMERLRRIDPRMADVVELRYYCGLKTAEIAAVMGLSLTTIKDDWSEARQWLRGQLGIE